MRGSWVVILESVRQGHSAQRDDLIRNMTAISKIPKQKWLCGSIHVAVGRALIYSQMLDEIVVSDQSLVPLRRSELLSNPVHR